MTISRDMAFSYDDAASSHSGALRRFIDIHHSQAFLPVRGQA
jgi:hypothetical protein